MARVVIDKDLGWKALEKNMRRNARGPNVTVGIQGTKAVESRAFDQTNASLAAIHEFGSKDGRIPSRPFMRGTVTRERRLILRMLGRAADRISQDGDYDRHLGLVGERVRAEMVRTIDRTIGLKKLAASTVAAKGSTKPLIDTGILKNSITWKVHAK